MAGYKNYKEFGQNQAAYNKKLTGTDKSVYR